LKKPGLIQRIDFLTTDQHRLFSQIATDHLHPRVVFDQPERMLFYAGKNAEATAIASVAGQRPRHGGRIFSMHYLVRRSGAIVTTA